MKLNTLIYYFVILNISLQADNSFDYFSKDLYIREEDNFKINMNKYLSFYSSSINFSSNNEKVKLPGLLSINSEVILPKIPFKTSEFKAENNHFFILENDKRTFYDIHFNENQEYVEIDSEVKRFLIINEKFGCNDIIVVEERVFLLCFNIFQQKKMKKEEKLEYRIVFYNYFKNTIEGSVKFNSSWMENPKFKLLNGVNRFFEKETNAKFVLFDKEINSESYEEKKKFYFFNIKLKKTESSVFELSGIKLKPFENVLFGGTPTKLKVENIIFSNENGKDNLIFVINKDEKGKKLGLVYKCTLKMTENIADSKLHDCEHFINSLIQNFFQKNDYFIYTTNKNEMFFCVKNKENCKSGKIQPNWKIEKIMIEETKAVVIMTINKNYIMFINDFETNQFTWVYEKIKDFKDFRLFRSFEKNENKFFLLNFYNKGFAKRDITFQNELIINTSMFKEFEPVSLYLENLEIMKLNVKPWGGERLVDLNEDHRYHVVKTDSDKYKLRLGWSGNNLNFENNEETFVYHYNNNKTEITSETLKKVGKIIIHADNTAKYIYIFHDNGIIINSCIFKIKKIISEFSCTEIKTVQYKKRDINNLVNITKIGNFILFDDKDSDKTNFYDKIKNQMVKIIKPENFKGYNYCRSRGNRFYCSYTDPKTKVDYLRFFRFLGNKLTEMKNLTKEFNLLIKELQETSRRNELTEIRIKNFQFDTTDKRIVLIHFHMIYNTNLENIFYEISTRRNSRDNNYFIKESKRKYDFENNADIKRNSEMHVMDSQVLFLTTEPKFKLFCYQDDSYFVFEYIDVKKIMQTLISSSNNKFAIVYQSHQNDKYYYAIFDVRQNSVKQLIRNEEIPEFKESMKLYLLKLDESRLLITLFDLETKKFIFSYVYFNKGPLMISNEISNGVLINDNIYDIQAIEDNTFNLSEYRYKKKENIIIQENTKPFSIIFGDYIDIKGNLKTVDLKSNIYGDSASIDVPLMLEKTEEISKIENGKLFVKTFAENFVYQLKEGNEFYIDTNKKKEIKIILGLDKGFNCQEIALTNESLICIWIKESFYFVTTKSFKNPEKEEEKFEISDNGDQLQVLEDNSSFLTIVLNSISRHKVLIYRFDRHQKNKNNYIVKNISKKTLATGNLKTSKFFSFLNAQTLITTVIIFDAENNKLYFYHSDIKTFKNKKILRKNIDLNFLEPLFDQVYCKEKEENSFIFKCTLYSASRIYLMEITKSLDINISDFTWDYKLSSEFHNVLYPNSFHYNYNLINTEFKNYIFLFDENSQTENSIVVYNTKEDHPYSYFIQKLENENKLESFHVVDEKLIVYYINKSKLIKQIYFIKDYRLNINNPQDFIKNKISFTAQFLNSNNYNLHLDFVHPEIVEEEVQKKGKGLLIFLIVSIVIVSLLILSAILTMIMLIKQRKKDINQNMTMNDTLNDPSFRISTIE